MDAYYQLVCFGKLVGDEDQVSLLRRTASLRSLSRSLRRQPTRSPSSHLPMLSWLLFLTSSSTLLSRWLAMISPAVFLQLGLEISSFMASILACSFWSTSLVLVSSPASFSSCAFMYSRMYFSPSLKDSSMMNSSLSLRFFNSSVITRYILELKFSIFMFMLEISFLTFRLRFYKHCEDSILADQKLVLWETSPAHSQLVGLGSLIPPKNLPSRPCSRSSKLPKRLSLSLGDTFRLLVWRGTKGLLGSRGVLKQCQEGKDCWLLQLSWQGMVLVGVILELVFLSLERLLLLLGAFLVGELLLLKREFFLRKSSRLLSSLLINKIINLSSPRQILGLPQSSIHPLLASLRVVAIVRGCLCYLVIGYYN